MYLFFAVVLLVAGIVVPFVIVLVLFTPLVIPVRLTVLILVLPTSFLVRHLVPMWEKCYILFLVSLKIWSEAQNTYTHVIQFQFSV